MEHTFEYMYEVKAQDSIDIPNIGNVCILATNSEYFEWYLATKTVDGWTEVETFGPLMVDVNKLDYSFKYTYNKFEYNEKNLIKRIGTFLEREVPMISQAVIIDREEFDNRLKNIKK